MIKKIAIYGKGGIGKSTTVANLSAVWAKDDLNCLVIGCDPKADTTRTLYGSRIPTVVNTLKDNRNPEVEDLVFTGFKDIKCVESGGPEPGVGCAGRGVIVAMKRLEKLGIFDEDLDVVVYDVLGDVVCGVSVWFTGQCRIHIRCSVLIQGITGANFCSKFSACTIWALHCHIDGGIGVVCVGGCVVVLSIGNIYCNDILSGGNADYLRICRCIYVC